MSTGVPPAAVVAVVAVAVGSATALEAGEVGAEPDVVGFPPTDGEVATEVAGGWDVVAVTFEAELHAPSTLIETVTTAAVVIFPNLMIVLSSVRSLLVTKTPD